ncbi:hypothetical protein V8G61_04640 [Gaetbulibacter sp. M240]|uniref:hypothetical protein n=1 Tax=Gaetbulibacter sp. M240 TaxID=3126511 RepID=UPI00374F6AE4
MKQVNYISHLNRVFQAFLEDTRLNTTHVSLYFALFHFWNLARFAEQFFINRNEVMQQSKIGSKGTYHKCINDLNQWKYIVYIPSKNPHRGSTVKMSKIGTSTEQVMEHYNTKKETSPEQVPGRNTNSNKLKKRVNISKPKNKIEVIHFFQEEGCKEDQALKFFNHYEALGWKKGNSKILNWKAAAQSWILNAKDYSSKNEISNVLGQNGNLHTKRNKNYNQPL